jgi:hypothetical protein
VTTLLIVVVASVVMALSVSWLITRASRRSPAWNIAAGALAAAVFTLLMVLFAIVATRRMFG